MLPEIKLDTQGFQELLEEYRAMIAGIYPEWTDYNYHDPGITFLELFVWLRENQQFHMEQLGPSHYEQFFRLLGFSRKKRKPARLLAQPQKEMCCCIPPGSRFQAGGMVFENEEEENLLGGSLKQVQSMEKDGNNVETVRAFPLSAMGGMCFYPFGSDPMPGNLCRFSLAQPLEPGKLYHLSLQVQKTEPIPRNPLMDAAFFSLAEVEWSYYGEGGWRSLEIKKDETHEFLFSGRLTFSIDERMEPFFEREGAFDEPGKPVGYVFQAVLRESHYDTAPVLSGISMNQILLTQKETWRNEEAFYLAEANGFPCQEYFLPWKEPIEESVEIAVEDVLSPGQFVPWKREEDFSECGPDSLSYRVDEERGSICFGDGFCGMPPEGRIRLLAMEATRGSGGNVKPGTAVLWERKEGAGEFVMVSERERGRDRETIEEALFRLGTGKRQGKRVVTAADYEKAVKETPGLMIYSCRVLEEEAGKNQVSIVVRPGSRKEPLALSQAYCKNILSHLNSRRLMGTRIRLLSPEYIGISLYLEVSAMPQYRQAKAMILEAVKEWFERLGAFFGHPISYGELYGMLEGMVCVKRLWSLGMEAGSAKVSRNQSGDLISPPNGVFLLKQVEYISVND